MRSILGIESIIKENQEEYYKVISDCDKAGNSNKFIEFMLKVINETIDDVLIKQKTTQETTQEKILNIIRENALVTQEEMAKILNITRDGVSYNIKALKDKGIIERKGSTKKGVWVIKNNK